MNQKENKNLEKVVLTTWGGMLDGGNYSIVFLDKKGNIIYMNRISFKKYLGLLSFDHLVKSPLKELHSKLRLNIHRSTNSLNQNERIVKLFSDTKRFIGYLFLVKEKEELPIDFTTHSIKNIFSKNIYDGLYLADAEANTIKVNNSYEKISLLPETEVVGKNLRELEEKGYFSKSVTLLVLEKLRLERIRDKISIRQRIITGKEALVTGIPIFLPSGKIKYVMTVVKEIIPIQYITDKLEFLADNKMWHGFNGEEKGEDVVKFNENVLIAMDEKTKNIINIIEKASSNSLPILLKGETGVGKDLMAKYIHYLKCKQYNRNLPFVMINCSALPEELLETEMFGYESGSFSGAKREGKKGLIELADNGILFLNEIEDMHINSQAKLLTILDNGAMRRIGGTREFKINFQLISATNKNIEKNIKEGNFREDLYYRISAVTVEIPPLRERRDDILPLIFFLVNKTYKDKKILNKKVLPVTVLELLVNYKWPGNVRELIYAIESIYTLSQGEIIAVNDLPYNILKNKFDNFVNNHQSFLPLRDSVKQYELNLIREALKKFGSATKAAEALQIDASTLRRKLKNS